MSEVLNQDEVDALLAAVEDTSGETQNDASPIRVFSSRGRGSALDALDIRPYDFKRPERVSKDQMRALQNLHELFSRNFGALLSGFLRTIIEVNVMPIEQTTFSEFTQSLPNPTCFTLLEPEPLEGHMCLEISPLIIYPIIDRLLGGSNADLFIPQRSLTDIELRLVHKIIHLAIRALNESWASVKQLSFKLGETDSNPQLVQIVAPNEVVVVVGFELKMGGRAGTMNMAIPYNVIEPVVDRLSAQTWEAYKKQRRDDKRRRQVAEHLDAARLTVSAVLAETTIRLSELANLEVGDVITTEKACKAPLTLLVEGRRKYIGKIGQFKGNRAFLVSRPYHHKDRV